MLRLPIPEQVWELQFLRGLLLLINWVYFPKSSPPPELGVLIVALFEEAADSIDSSKKAEQHSDVVMARVRPGLEKLGFRVEKGKSKDDKIVVPVLIQPEREILNASMLRFAASGLCS